MILDKLNFAGYNQFFIFSCRIILLNRIRPYAPTLALLCSGMLFALGFAPFHWPACLYCGLLLFFYFIQTSTTPFKHGFYFGVGVGLIGISWVYICIYEYGHLPKPLAAFFTLVFICYIALFYAGFAYLNKMTCKKTPPWLWPFSIAACWCCFEWIRSHLFGGFPWLMLGFSALKSPLEKLLPWFGIYGPGFVMCFALACLVYACQRKPWYSILGVLCFILPQYLPLSASNKNQQTRVHAAMVQGNTTMQDKWDADKFWGQFGYYLNEIHQLLKPMQVVILPEAAISVPTSFIHRELEQLDNIAHLKKSAVLIGIPKPAQEHNSYYNAMLGLGEAKGFYHKQQLVVFGELIPEFLYPLFKFLDMPLVSTIPGEKNQPLIEVFNQPIASLICYELAYPDILRQQLPKAQWIVSLSDDGWFGHSSAIYQHLEMAQTLSYMSHRPQIFVNNNGLSSIINAQGQIIQQIRPWHQGHSSASFTSENNTMPWMFWGDLPILCLCLIILITCASLQIVRATMGRQSLLKIDT